MLVKQLTHSDCSYFEVYHRRTGMKQKAVNLDQAKMKALFPSLVNATNATRFDATVHVFVSGSRPIVDDQTITLSQKNWRLNGLLHGDLDVNPGDVLVCQILGDDAAAPERVPVGVAMAVVRNGDTGHEWLRGHCPDNGFANLDESVLLGARDWPEDGAVWQLIDFLTQGLANIVSDVIGEHEANVLPVMALRSYDRTGSTREAVDRLGRLRAAIGLGGETLVDSVLQRRRDLGLISRYEWVSASNALAPLDFRAQHSEITVGIEVKTTKGRHDVPFVISLSELREAMRLIQYEIWRVSAFRFDERSLGGEIRTTDPSPLVTATVQWVATAPSGVKVPSVEFDPRALPWSDPESASCSTERVPSESWVEDMTPVP